MTLISDLAMSTMSLEEELAAAQQTIQQQADTILQQQAVIDNAERIIGWARTTGDAGAYSQCVLDRYKMSHNESQALADHDRKKDEQIAMLREALEIAHEHVPIHGRDEIHNKRLDKINSALSATEATATKFMNKHDIELLEELNNFPYSHQRNDRITEMIVDRKAKC